ncbi:MAG: hypothetical protein CL504_02375 [Actinobacteria bacterium]|nr:hypothetical protein [Actinomycetota bacterium]
MSYEIFAEGTLGGTASSVDLTLIPQTATHLELYFNSRSNKADASHRGGGLRINNISSNSYGLNGVYGESSTSAAVWNRTMGSRDWVDDAIRHWNNNASAGLFAPSKMLIPNYTSTTTTSKGVIIRNSTWGEDTSQYWIMEAMGNCTTSAAVTRLTIYPESGSLFVAGTSYYLAGWE